MPEIPEGLAGARYKGHGTGLRQGIDYRNTDGSKRESLSLEPGDELLLQDEDVYGKTLLHDPNQNLPSQYIGLGKVVKPEHAGKNDQELQEIGYEWHMPRPDVEPVEPLDVFLKRRKKAGKKEKARETSQTIIVEQSAQEESEQL